jgi:hypothetical protein
VNLEKINRATAAVLAFIFAVVLFVALAVGVKLLISAPPIDADPAAARSQALAEINAAEDKALSTLAFTDKQHGIVQLPIEVAMKIASEKWSTPAAARADLEARVAKATAPVKAVSFE